MLAGGKKLGGGGGAVCCAVTDGAAGDLHFAISPRQEEFAGGSGCTSLPLATAISGIARLSLEKSLV